MKNCLSYEIRTLRILCFFFDFINALTSFQDLINRILIEKLNIFIIVYLNNIIIYFVNKNEHIEHVK